MLEMVEAIRFDRIMTKGRTLPLLMVAEHSDGIEVELIGKFSDGQNIGANGLAREAITAMLAADLGLPVPPPLLVRVSEAFIDTMPIRLTPKDTIGGSFTRRQTLPVVAAPSFWALTG